MADHEITNEVESASRRVFMRRALLGLAALVGTAAAGEALMPSTSPSTDAETTRFGSGTYGGKGKSL